MNSIKTRLISNANVFFVVKIKNLDIILNNNRNKIREPGEI